MGEVYKARDTRLDRTVAVKVLLADLAADPDRRARFEREARAIAALSHPHICTIHDVGRHDEIAWTRRAKRTSHAARSRDWFEELKARVPTK
jgi:serine/threonine protein kinase